MEGRLTDTLLKYIFPSLRVAICKVNYEDEGF